MRKEAVAGMFYPGDKRQLQEEIKQCFLSKLGAGLPGTPKQELRAVISPHAGYSFSGACASHAYKAIAEAKKPELFIILGPSHQGMPSCVSLEDWKTPLGVVKVDGEFGKKLLENSKLVVDEQAHAGEHSIEVQLPFLQFVCKEFKFLPVMISNDISFREAAEGIRKTIEQTKKKVVLIVSSDFTHYGPNYGYTLVGDAKEAMYRLDSEAIEAIKSLKPERFLAHLKKHDATICGALPILVLIEILSKIKSREKTKATPRAELLKYYTSGDIAGDYTNAVGYAAMAFY